MQQASLKRYQLSGTGTQIKKRKQQKYLREKNEERGWNEKVILFKNLLQESPYYICVVCNRCIYRISVVLYSEEKVPLLDQNPLNFVETDNDSFNEVNNTRTESEEPPVSDWLRFLVFTVSAFEQFFGISSSACIEIKGLEKLSSTVSLWTLAGLFSVVMRCAIWHHLYNLKNVKNTHGGLLS